MDTAIGDLRLEHHLIKPACALRRLVVRQCLEQWVRRVKAEVRDGNRGRSGLGFSERILGDHYRGRLMQLANGRTVMRIESEGLTDWRVEMTVVIPD